MPRGATFGSRTNPASFVHIGRFGPSESELAGFLYPYAFRDVILLREDFLLEEGTAVTGSGIWVAAGLNGTDFAAPATQLANGVVTAVLNNVAGDNNTIRTGAFWLGDNDCGMEMRWKVADGTNLMFEMGFVDPLTSYDDLALNDIDTPSITNGAVDVALIAQDASQTLTTMAYITDGSTANMNTTKTNLGTRTPTNATYLTCRVQLNGAGNTSSAFVFDENDALVESASHGSALASQTEGATLRHLWGAWETKSTENKTIDLDSVYAWQNVRSIAV